MQNILVSKQDSENTYTTDYVKEVFESSEDLQLIKSVVEKASDRVYVSWASVDARDKEGEKIPINDIIKQQRVLLERNAPIMDSHSNVHVGTTLSFKVLQHPKTKTLGVLHLNKIFDHNDTDTKVWHAIKEGKYTGSSVGGYSRGSTIDFDDETKQFTRNLEGFNQFETSAVENPCNPFATNEAFSVVAKSETSKVEGEDIHSDKWKRCVEQVEQESPDVNAFAVCTAQLGEESFKEDTQEKQKMTNKENIEKREDVLDQIMAKITAGEELSEEEEKIIGAARDAAAQAMNGNSEEEDQEKAEHSDMEDDEDTVKALVNEVKNLSERMNEIEMAISGGSDNEEEEEKQSPEEDEETEKSDEGEEEQSSDSQESDQEVSKSELEDIRSTVKAMSEKLEQVYTVKSERPSAKYEAPQASNDPETARKEQVTKKLLNL